MVPHPLGTRLPFSSGLLCAADRVGMYELRTAGASRPALPFKLVLRYDSIFYGTTASRVSFFYGLGAPCGSTTGFCSADLRARMAGAVFAFPDASLLLKNFYKISPNL